MVKTDRYLIRSLNSQLLSLYDFDLGFVRFSQWYKGLRQLDLRTLCRLFRKLVGQLPQMATFYIVDGISLRIRAPET